jgi:hypothetical protein
MEAVQLSPFDHMARYNYIRYIFCYACDDTMRKARRERWRHVLSSLVKMYPFLAGKITDLNDYNNPKLHMTSDLPSTFDVVAHGLLRFAELDLNYGDLQKAHFPPSLLHAEQLHWLPVAPLPGEQQVFSVQATFVRGGLLVATWWHHAIIDGTGACSILQGLGQLIRGMSMGTEDEIVPQLDNVGRKDFHEADATITPTAGDIEEIVVRNSSSTSASLPETPREKVISKVFGFNIADIQRIKRSDARYASPFRCAVALLLVAILRIRSKLCRDAGEDWPGCRLFILVDARTALKAPPNFLGNSVHGKFLKWDARDDLQIGQNLDEVPTCLTLALDRICATIHAVRQPSYMTKRLAFIQRHHCPELDLRVDNTNLICNSWEEVGKVSSNIEFEAVGLGALDHVRRPHAANSGAILVLPRLAGSSLIEVDVGLPEREMLGLIRELKGWKQRAWLKQVLE